MPVGIFLPRREPRYTQGLPIHDSANSPRRSLFACLLVLDLSIADPTRRIGIELHGTALGTETPYACPGLSRFTLGKGSMSVCLGSSAAGGPASESGTSFTAHASAHDPKVNFFCCERAMGPRRVFISFESAGVSVVFCEEPRCAMTAMVATETGGKSLIWRAPELLPQPLLKFLNPMWIFQLQRW